MVSEKRQQGLIEEIAYSATYLEHRPRVQLLFCLGPQSCRPVGDVLLDRILDNESLDERRTSLTEPMASLDCLFEGIKAPDWTEEDHAIGENKVTGYQLVSSFPEVSVRTTYRPRAAKRRSSKQTLTSLRWKSMRAWSRWPFPLPYPAKHLTCQPYDQYPAFGSSQNNNTHDLTSNKSNASVR